MAGEELISMQEFLETVPPGIPRKISGFTVAIARVGQSQSSAKPLAGQQGTLKTVDINLFCNDAACDRVQFFRMLRPNQHCAGGSNKGPDRYFFAFEASSRKRKLNQFAVVQMKIDSANTLDLPKNRQRASAPQN